MTLVALLGAMFALTFTTFNTEMRQGPQRECVTTTHRDNATEKPYTREVCKENTNIQDAIGGVVVAVLSGSLLIAAAVLRPSPKPQLYPYAAPQVPPQQYPAPQGPQQQQPWRGEHQP